MLEVVATSYNGRRRIVQIYNEWDVDQKDVVGYDCTKKDKGKYLKFDDGSNWYVKILNCSDTAIKTEAGTVRRNDLVHCSRIKWVGGWYTGTPSAVENFKIRGPSKREKALSTRLINKTLGDNRITPRIKMLALEKLAKSVNDHGVTEDWVVERLLEWANGNGMHAMSALEKICRISGIELNQQKQLGGGNLGIFQQFNIGGKTIQDARRSQHAMSLPEILKMIPDKEQTAEEIEVITSDEYSNDRV